VGGLKRTWVVVLAIAASLLIAEALPAIADSGDSAHAVAAKKKCKKKKAAATAKKKKKCKKPAHLAPSTPATPTPTPPVSTPAQLAISPGSHAYPSTVVGGGSEFTFTVSNAGTSPTGALVSQVDGPDAVDFEFASDNCPTTLAGGASCSIVLRFNPEDAGAATATLMVSASPGGSATANLTGTGFTSITISGSDPDIFIFSTESHVFTITNTGPAATGFVSAMLLSGEAFDITADTCTDVLAASGSMGDSCTVTVTFNPPHLGGFADSLMVGANPGGSPERELSGIAVM
jgi:hypothetical protein